MPSQPLPHTVERRPVTDMLMAQLRAGCVTPGGDALPVGDGHVPAAEDTTNPTTPYAIIYELPGPLSGVPADAQSDAALGYQVTSVGLTRSECGGMADLVRRVLTAAALPDADGVTVVRCESDSVPETTRVGPLFQAAETFTLWVSAVQ